MNDYPCITTGDPPLHILLRRRREELRMLQADVAERLNVSPEAVTLWEGGRRRMELCKIPRLAQALQMDPKELCTRALEEYHPAFYHSLFGRRGAAAATTPQPE